MNLCSSEMLPEIKLDHRYKQCKYSLINSSNYIAGRNQSCTLHMTNLLQTFTRYLVVLRPHLVQNSITLYINVMFCAWFCCDKRRQSEARVDLVHYSCIYEIRPASPKDRKGRAVWDYDSLDPMWFAFNPPNLNCLPLPLLSASECLSHRDAITRYCFSFR